MPGIQDEIDTRKQEISVLQHRIEILHAQIEAFEMALRYVGTTEGAADTYSEGSRRFQEPRNAVYRGGRQPGAISRRWKANFRDLVNLGRAFTVEDIAAVVHANEGREIRPAEARRLFDGYTQHGYVDAHADGSYTITTSAIDRFGLKASEMETPPEGGESDDGDGDDSQGSVSHSAPASSSPVTPIISHRTGERFLGGSFLSGAQQNLLLPLKR